MQATAGHSEELDKGCGSYTVVGDPEHEATGTESKGGFGHGSYEGCGSVPDNFTITPVLGAANHPLEPLIPIASVL